MSRNEEMYIREKSGKKPEGAPPPPNKFLSQEELAKRWNLSHRTLERWRWIGSGPSHFKAGGKVRYRLDDVLAFEKERTFENMNDYPRIEKIKTLVKDFYSLDMIADALKDNITESQYTEKHGVSTHQVFKDSAREIIKIIKALEE